MHIATKIKIASLAAGVAAGGAVGYIARRELPSPETEQRLKNQGVEVMSEREAVSILAPSFFVGAAAIGTGIGHRSKTAALSTISLGAAAMLASTGASAMINANSELSSDYLHTLGLLGATATIGFGVGSVKAIPQTAAKSAGLAALGVAVGLLTNETLNYLKTAGRDISNGLNYEDNKR